MSSVRTPHRRSAAPADPGRRPRRRLAAVAVSSITLTGTVAVLAALPAAPAGASAVAGPTWTGQGPSGSTWTTTANWQGGTIPAAGSILTFPDLSGEGSCTASPPTATCYTSTDDMPGLDVSGVDFAPGADRYELQAAPAVSLGLGAGGVNVAATAGSNGSLDASSVPLALTADQTWHVDGPGGLVQGASVAPAPGMSPAPSLAVDLAGGGALGLFAQVETGGFTAVGASSKATGDAAYQNGVVGLLPFGPPGTTAGIDAATGAPVDVKDVALQAEGTIGPLTSTGAAVTVGMSAPATPGSLGAGILKIAGTGSATFDAASVLGLSITGTGTTPGFDSALLAAPGTVQLDGAMLQVTDGILSGTSTDTCPTLTPGTTYTLVQAKSLQGEVSGPTGLVADGQTVPVGFLQGCAPQAVALQLTYDKASTPNTLTAKVVTVTAPTGGPTPTVLYVTGSGSDSGGTNPCTVPANPCGTIQHAVDEAEQTAGAVQVDVAPGTYHEQVTVAPGASSPMTALTLAGPPPSSGTPAVVEPTALVQNVTEGSTGNFFDDNTGNTAAIVGVQTGSPDAAAGVAATAAHPATVVVSGLTVSGAELGGLPPGGELEGIAMVDTSGSVAGNTVEDIEQPNAIGQASVHGIEVKATAVHATVDLAGNTARSGAGHVAVDLMSAPGDLAATVTGNQLTGDPVATIAPVAQFGIAAGGLGSIAVSGNTITDYQSPWSVGAVWLDAQAPGARCAVSGNTLTADDNGVDLHGASGCTISGNTITAGSAGVEIGPSYLGTTVASDGDSIVANDIAGTTTEATHYQYNGSATPVAAVAGVPVDGVLVWDGTGTAVQDNAISGFARDVYAGEDPVYLDNAASWGPSVPSPYSGYAVGGTTVVDDSLTGTVAAVAGSHVASAGTVQADVPGGTAALAATDDWWGCAGGPGAAGCSAAVGATTAPWLATLALTPATQSVTAGATATVTATLRDETGAAVPAPLAVGYTTTPAAGSGTVGLDTAGALGGTAALHVSTSTAATVHVGAAVAFGSAATGGTPAPGLGGSASVTFTQPVVVTPAGGSSGPPPSPPSPPAGATSSRSATSASSTGTATVTDGGVTAAGAGEGSFTVSQYGSDPVGAPTFASAGGYFDVRVASGSSFTSLTVTDCNLGGGTGLDYWTGSSWQAVSPASYTAGPPACVTATLGTSSTPSIAELTGTVFAVTGPAVSPGPAQPPVTKPASGSQGYRLVGADGGVFAFGSAGFFGSMGATHLHRPVVAAASVPGGAGYWLVASDGGVFAFGDAAFHGSLPADGVHVSDVVGMAATPGGGGYWLVSSDGGVFAFGDARYLGSAPEVGAHVTDVRAIVATPGGGGYWLAGAHGGIFAFGDAGYAGSLPGVGVDVSDVVAITTAG